MNYVFVDEEVPFNFNADTCEYEQPKFVILIIWTFYNWGPVFNLQFEVEEVNDKESWLQGGSLF